MDVATRVARVMATSLLLLVAGCASSPWSMPSVEDLAPENVSKSIRHVSGFGPDEQLARSLFDSAEAEFKQAISAADGPDRDLLLQAADKYHKAARRWPDSALEEDALFMLAESYFFVDQYPKAMAALNDLIKAHPNTRHLDTVDARRFAVAQYWLAQHADDPQALLQPNVSDSSRPRFDTFGNALKLFELIRYEDPTGKLADDATMAAAVARFKRGDYARADAFLKDLRKSFPNSPHQFKACLMALDCKRQLYQGPDYDDTPLAEAEEILAQLRLQFPEPSQQYAQQLSEVYKWVRLSKAEQDWLVAKFYDRRMEYRAARLYYQIVANEYQDTSRAQDARERLAEIADKPAEPPQYLGWLADMFPDESPPHPLLATGPEDSTRR